MKNTYDLILLDSGFYSPKKIQLSTIDVYEPEGEIWSVREQNEDSIGHGTAVMSIISNYKKGRYAIFKVFNSLGESNLSKIISALEYIYENLECSFIQMSFGVRGYDKKLDELCKKNYEQGKIILAAFDNYGAMSYPAAFSYVIGVSGDAFCLKRDSFHVSYTGVIDVFAKSGTQIVSQNNKRGFSLQQGNSFAASYASLYLLQSGKKFKNKIEAMQYFDLDYHEMPNTSVTSCLGSKAVVFPLNKEVYNLVHYTELLKVNLVAMYDIKYSGNLRKEIINLNGDRSFIVRNIVDCNWDEFETMIVGHLRELSLLVGKNLKREILLQCLEHKKNVYCFDAYEVESLRPLFVKENLKLECAEDYIKHDNYGKLYQLKTPVLAVLGTGKKQGKFTLQMQIMKLLRENKIRVGVLGTEPNSVLFGCDAMIPIGYDALINSYSGQYIIEACNEQMHNVDVKGFQLILTGGQSGFLPHFKFNSNHININQISFIYGIQPDGIILVVNYRDSIDYIKKSINALQVISSAKVFLLGMYAFDVEYDNINYAMKRRLTEEEIKNKCCTVKKELGIPMVICGESSCNEELFNEIINYYCE